VPLSHVSTLYPFDRKLLAYIVVIGFREKGFLNLELVSVTFNVDDAVYYELKPVILRVSYVVAICDTYVEVLIISMHFKLGLDDEEQSIKYPELLAEKSDEVY
jgi:hypothetical protein